MKKLLLIIVSFCFFCGLAYAVIKTPVVTALNASTYTAIVVPAASHRAISAYTEDATAWTVAIDASGTGAAVIPANSSLSIDDVGDSSSTIFYAKASAGTPNLVVIYR